MTPMKNYTTILALCTLLASGAAPVFGSSAKPSFQSQAMQSLQQQTAQVTTTILGVKPNFPVPDSNGNLQRDFKITVSPFISLTLKQGTSITGTLLSIIQKALLSSSQPALALGISSSTNPPIPASTSTFSVQGDSNGSITSITLTSDLIIQNPTQVIKTLSLGKSSLIFFDILRNIVSIQPARNSYIVTDSGRYSSFMLNANDGKLLLPLILPSN